MHDEEVYAERCLHAGARGYINKKEASESVITAIRQILQGNVFLSANMTARVLNKFQGKTSSLDASPISRLTNRELEIFNLIGKGMVAGAISGRLHISVKTVYAHMERIKEKLGIRHSYELVRYAALAMEKESLKVSPDFE
jgi:DNA-binding NarL/FixJ family response regulator